MRKIILSAAILSAGLLLTACNCNDKKAPAGYTDKEAIANILARKSVRSYTPQEVDAEKVDLMIRAGMAAPSGMDRRPWEIVVVTEKPILEKLAEGLPYAKMTAGAPMAFVVCGDSVRSSYWYLDCSAVTQNILLAAEALGLGAVWTAAYPYDERMAVVKGAIEMPENVLPFAVVPVGYPDGDFQPKDKYDPAKIHYNKW